MDDRQLELWGSGIDSEIGFWDGWFRTKGSEWPDDYAARLAPDTPIDPFFVDILGAVDLTTVKILDVGAGPISKHGKVHKGIKLDIVACDPLADYYAAIRDKYEVTPPIRTTKSFAEDLASFFPSDHFDLVTCTNALDHSFEPLRGIAQMLEVVKPGGVVVLRHAFNEADHNEYTGLHQWNFDLQDGRFIIWNPNYRIDVAEVLAPFATVRAEDLGYMTAIITKQNPISSSELVDPRARVRELLNLLTGNSYRRGQDKNAAEAKAVRAEAKAVRVEAKAAAAKAKAAAAEAKAAVAESRYNAALRSTSWRITAPMRSLSRLLKAVAPKRT